MINDDTLGQKIADSVMKKFDSLSSKAGKPGTRSNGIKEWTVLASVIIIDDDEIIPIIITTGVKALPDKIRSYSNGLIVHDLHAEILALRAFNRFLIDECKKPHSLYLKKTNSNYKFKESMRIALFISEPPCGDASMSVLSENSEDNTSWEYKRHKPELIRGRSHFNKLGLVRTKPGRADSIETLSKSCSDKLCLKQLIGLNNSITSEFIDPIFLDYLVLKADKFKVKDIERCFYVRFPLATNPLKVLVYDTDNFEFHKNSDSLPSPNSLVYISEEIHVLNNGVKIGSHRKNNHPKPGGESILCNKRMFNDSQSLFNTDKNTYIKFKQTQKERQALKLKGKEYLENWIPTSPDDFSI